MENNNNNTLSHHGIKGQQWGRRRYQNPDGTLTALGRKRYAKELAEYKKEKEILKNKAATKAKIDKLTAMKKQLEEEKRKLAGEDVDTDDTPETKSTSSSTTKTEVQQTTQKKSSNKKRLKDLSDEELQERINRINLEKKYIALMSEQETKKESKSKSFFKEVLTNSGKNIATQTATYMMGTMVNKVAKDFFNATDPKIVNPKKGQKDK